VITYQKKKVGNKKVAANSSSYNIFWYILLWHGDSGDNSSIQYISICLLISEYTNKKFIIASVVAY
jgi:hypothetical protein